MNRNKKKKMNFWVLGKLLEFMASQSGPIDIPPSMLQAITKDIGYHPELDGTMLLLKTPQTCATEYGASSWSSLASFHSYWIVLKVLESAVHAIKRKKDSAILSKCKLCDLQNGQLRLSH